MEQGLPRGGRELVPRHVHRDAFALRELGERAALVVVARLRPRVDRAVAQRTCRVGNDERFVILERRAESVAALARAARTVEREQLRRRSRRARSVVRAFVSFGEAQLAGRLLCERGPNRRGEQNDAIAVAFAKRRSHGVGEAAARLVSDGESVDDDEHLFGERDVDRLGHQIVEVLDRAVERDAHEPLRAEVFDDDVVRHLFREVQRKRDVEACAGFEARAPRR